MERTEIEALANKEANAHFASKVLKTSYSHWDTLAREHAIAFTVAKMMEQDLLADTYKIMQKAMQEGKTFAEFQKELKPRLMKAGWWGEKITKTENGKTVTVRLGSESRLRTIFHTNKHSAYAAGQWARIQENKKALPYLQYMPSLSNNPREKHKRYYGLVRPVDDPIWQSIFPPNGYNCLCWVRQLSKEQAEKIGISDEIKLEMRSVLNPRSGEILKTPQGIHPSFNHNHDRLSAMQAIYHEKLNYNWDHIPKAFKEQAEKEFKEQLEKYMLDLVESPYFTRHVPTINGEGFAVRFQALQNLLNANKDNSEALLKIKKSLDERLWVAGTLSAKLKKQMASKQNIVVVKEADLLSIMVKHQEFTQIEGARRLPQLFRTLEDWQRKGNKASATFKLGDKSYKAHFLIAETRLYLSDILKEDEKAVEKANMMMNLTDLLERPNFIKGTPQLHAVKASEKFQEVIDFHAGRGVGIGIVPVGQEGSIEWVKHQDKNYLLSYGKDGISVKAITEKKLQEQRKSANMLLVNKILNLEGSDPLPNYVKRNLPEIPYADKIAAYLYSTDAGYQEINPPLIKNKRDLTKLEERELQFVQALDYFLKIAPKYNGQSMRNVNLRAMTDEVRAKFLEAHEEGKIIRYSNFTSTKKGNSEGVGNGELLLRIKGKSGVDISMLSRYRTENEVLYPRHSVYRVLSKKIFSSRIVVELEEIEDWADNEPIQLSFKGAK